MRTPSITWNGVPVKVSHIRPPIPTTAFDYCAYLDGREESGPEGYGELLQWLYDMEVS